MPPDATRGQPTTRRMLVLVGLLLLVAGIATLSLKAINHRANVREIRAVYERVMECIRSTDAEGLRANAGPGTWAWAESMLDAARHADAARFASLGFQEKLTVLELRLKHTGAELANRTAADVLAMMPLASVGADLQLVQIYIDGDTAHATIDKITGNVADHIANGPLFTRRDGQWQMEWHLIPIQILKNAGPPPSNDELRTIYIDSHLGVWDDRLLDGPR